MYTLSDIYTSIYQIKQSVLLCYILIFFFKGIPHECGVYTTLTKALIFEEPIHIRVPCSHAKFHKH